VDADKADRVAFECGGFDYDVGFPTPTASGSDTAPRKFIEQAMADAIYAWMC